MKVWEVIAALSELPAGADVYLRALVTLEELKDAGPVDEDNGVGYYSIYKKVEEIEEMGDQEVVLYV